MAETRKTPEAPKAPTAPTAQKPPTVEKPKDTTPRGADAVEYWPTKEKAEEVAKTRTKGAYRSFTITKDGKTEYATANHYHFVCANKMKSLGYEITETGKPERAPRTVGVEAISAALNSLNENDRAAIKAQLDKLLGK